MTSLRLAVLGAILVISLGAALAPVLALEQRMLIDLLIR